MKKFFAVVAASLILFASIAGAEIKTYTGTGEYLMSDFEDIDVARERAKERAQENARLTVDEISAVTNNITEMVVVVEIDPDKLAEAVEREKQRRNLP